ncbi:hypothetical protein CH63R_08212 [Colletotrichum higginsianum IMI 349063]|uniref:Uncharacterized protein n=1 Tax=Colletotrichum higginsianum (strain IMI 349063) TaxID=759273 RepID=A0A1B7YBQ1_COLHI|nr:hypothetical protein CH63R_08212 [Colletotrichum higginsianum IMI 349063]OBR09447.1 hypothetical protein CH63R_08212 [Colletotrichum higginsianum IMI 349063]GJC96479.1 hypothetical protein ColKHC_05305 [Colletotrichum higginsianum]
MAQRVRGLVFTPAPRLGRARLTRPTIEPSPAPLEAAGSRYRFAGLVPAILKDRGLVANNRSHKPQHQLIETKSRAGGGCEADYQDRLGQNSTWLTAGHPRKG